MAEKRRFMKFFKVDTLRVIGIFDQYLAGILSLAELLEFQNSTVLSDHPLMSDVRRFILV